MIGFQRVSTAAPAARFIRSIADELTLHDCDAHQVARAPVALHEAPGARYVNCVPGVPEPVALEFHPGLVSGRFAVALDHNAVEASIASRVCVVGNESTREERLSVSWAAIFVCSSFGSVGFLSRRIFYESQANSLHQVPLAE